MLTNSWMRGLSLLCSCVCEPIFKMLSKERREKSDDYKIFYQTSLFKYSWEKSNEIAKGEVSGLQKRD
jgi:hypothetical protein